jgi:hypothetical protein
VKFIVKEICETGIQVVGKFDTYEEALAAKEDLLSDQEFSECFVEIIPPQGFQLAGIGA